MRTKVSRLKSLKTEYRTKVCIFDPSDLDHTIRRYSHTIKELRELRNTNLTNGVHLSNAFHAFGVIRWARITMGCIYIHINGINGCINLLIPEIAMPALSYRGGFDHALLFDMSNATA